MYLGRYLGRIDLTYPLVYTGFICVYLFLKIKCFNFGILYTF